MESSQSSYFKIKSLVKSPTYITNRIKIENIESKRETRLLIHWQKKELRSKPEYMADK